VILGQHFEHVPHLRVHGVDVERIAINEDVARGRQRVAGMLHHHRLAVIGGQQRYHIGAGRFASLTLHYLVRNLKPGTKRL
jgi:hypothetical protein